jgi:hypothetical protein
MTAAIALSACGTSIHPAGSAGGRGRVDDPRIDAPNRMQCLLQHHLPVTEVGTTGLQIGSAPSGPRVVFTPTAGAAQADQIRDREQGAEVIGSALLYPDEGSDQLLSVIEDCLSTGVKG